jgi:hypothetical protein
VSIGHSGKFWTGDYESEWCRCLQIVRRIMCSLSATYRVLHENISTMQFDFGSIASNAVCLKSLGYSDRLIRLDSGTELEARPRAVQVQVQSPPTTNYVVVLVQSGV